MATTIPTNSIAESLWGVLSLVSKETIGVEELLLNIIQKASDNGKELNSSTLSVEVRKLILELGLEVDLETFRSRVNARRISKEDLNVFYLSFVRLKSLSEIANITNEDYSIVGKRLRNVFQELRGKGKLTLLK